MTDELRKFDEMRGNWTMVELCEARQWIDWRKFNNHWVGQWMDPKELARQLEEGETTDELAKRFDIPRKWDNRQNLSEMDNGIIWRCWVRDDPMEGRPWMNSKMTMVEFGEVGHWVNHRKMDLWINWETLGIIWFRGIGQFMNNLKFVIIIIILLSILRQCMSVG